MDEVKLYNKIYKRRPDKWANDFVRNWCAYNALYKYIDPPESLLDIGCGNGHTIEFLQKMWPDTSFVGIDYSDVAIGLAEKRAPDALFLQGNFKDYVMECDVITIMGVAEHFEKLVDDLIEVKDRGKLFYIEVPDCLRNGKWNGSKNMNEGFRKTFKGGLQVEWHLTRRSWERRFKLAKFEILEFVPGPSPAFFGWVLR